MTQPPFDPAAEAEIALRGTPETIAVKAALQRLANIAGFYVAVTPTPVINAMSDVIEAMHPIAEERSDLLADIAALRTRAKEARFQGKQASSAAFAAEALAESWKSTAEAEAEIGNERAADLAESRAEVARLKAEREAAAYLIDRLQACHAGKRVRDLDEATSAYETARAPTTAKGGSNDDPA